MAHDNSNCFKDSFYLDYVMRKPEIILRTPDGKGHTIRLYFLPKKGEEITHNSVLYSVDQIRHFTFPNSILIFVSKIKEL